MAERTDNAGWDPERPQWRHGFETFPGLKSIGANLMWSAAERGTQQPGVEHDCGDAREGGAPKIDATAPMHRS